MTTIRADKLTPDLRGRTVTFSRLGETLTGQFVSAWLHLTREKVTVSLVNGCTYYVDADTPVTILPNVEKVRAGSLCHDHIGRKIVGCSVIYRVTQGDVYTTIYMIETARMRVEYDDIIELEVEA